MSNLMNRGIDPQDSDQERRNFENLIYYAYNEMVSKKTHDNWLRLGTAKAIREAKHPGIILRQQQIEGVVEGGDHYPDPATAYRDNPRLAQIQSNPVLHKVLADNMRGAGDPNLSWGQAKSTLPTIKKPKRREPPTNAELGEILYPYPAAVKAKEDRNSNFGPVSKGQIGQKIKEDRNYVKETYEFKPDYASHQQWLLAQENPVLHDILARNHHTRTGNLNKETGSLPGNQTKFKGREWRESRDKTWKWSENFAKRMMGLNYSGAAASGATAALMAGTLLVVASGPAALPAAMGRLALFGLSEAVGSLLSDLGEEGLVEMGMPKNFASTFNEALNLYLTMKALSKGYVRL